MKNTLLSALAIAARLSVSQFNAARAADTDLYPSLGGSDGIGKVTDTFLGKVLADGRINGFFADANAKRLRKQLVDQLCEATGGPCKYTGGDMASVHKNMKIKAADFSALVEDLVAALNQHGVPADLQNALLAKLGPMQKDIVTQ